MVETNSGSDNVPFRVSELVSLTDDRSVELIIVGKTASVRVHSGDPRVFFSEDDLCGRRSLSKVFLVRTRKAVGRILRVLFGSQSCPCERSAYK